MELPNVQPWEKVPILEQIGPIVPLLHEAAEDATHRARAFFDELGWPEGERTDPFLFAHLVRFHVGRFLDSRGHATDLDKQWMSNSGVAFRCGWTDVRFIKSSYGRLPAPGPSRTRRRFYHQDITTPFWESSLENRHSIVLVNLVITWDIDYRGSLSQLVAYSPSAGASSASSVNWHWAEVLAHPATTYAPPPPQSTEAGDDLDITDDDRVGEEPADDAGEADAG